jgi:hypothetical protein
LATQVQQRRSGLIYICLRVVQQNPDIGDIIQFRQSLSYLNSPLPFGVPFGPASTRQECLDSSDTVYSRLLQCIPEKEVVTFDVLAMLALCDSGELDDELLGQLVKLFRPDREGKLTRLDFVKSVDSVYKDLKLLRASVANASKVSFGAYRTSWLIQQF